MKFINLVYTRQWFLFMFLNKGIKSEVVLAIYSHQDRFEWHLYLNVLHSNINASLICHDDIKQFILWTVNPFGHIEYCNIINLAFSTRGVMFTEIGSYK